MYDGMHEASPDEIARRMTDRSIPVQPSWLATAQEIHASGVSMLVPDPPREATLTELDGTVTNWVEVSQDEPGHRLEIRRLNDNGYVVIRRVKT